jgi:YbbR domain-containing protein
MLRNNKFNLLISVVAAIVFWAYVSVAVNPPSDLTITEVPVELTNLEALHDRGLTVDPTQAYSVGVTLNGPRSEVRKLTASDIRATVDMTGYPKGIVDVQVMVAVPNDDVEFVQATPETLTVEVVDLITVTKPVRLEYADDFPDGVEPGFVTVIPNEMEVAGIARIVDNIDHIRASVPEGVLSEDETKLKLEPIAIRKDGSPDYNVNLSQEIQVTATLCQVKQVALSVETVGELSETVEITAIDEFPTSISVRGTASGLEDLPTKLTQRIDLSRITDTIEIPIDPDLPEGVEIANASSGLSVKIEVMGIASRRFEFTREMIAVEGLRSSLDGNVMTGSVIVTLLAPESEINEILPDDLHLFVDASEITRAADMIEIELQITCDKEYKSLSADPQMVRVTITGKNGLRS